MKRMASLLTALLLAYTSGLFAQAELGVDDLAPGLFLVAARELRDPNFATSVVLVTAYGESGAMGLIVNRPSLTPLSRYFPALKGKAGASPIYDGGPVSRSGALALIRSKSKPEPGAKPVLQNTYLASSKELLEKLLDEGGSGDKLRVYAGYAGWGPGQLDGEVDAGAWYIVRGSEAQIFDAKPDTLWERLMRRATMRMARNAPAARSSDRERGH